MLRRVADLTGDILCPTRKKALHGHYCCFSWVSKPRELMHGVLKRINSTLISQSMTLT